MMGNLSPTDTVIWQNILKVKQFANGKGLKIKTMVVHPSMYKSIMTLIQQLGSYNDAFISHQGKVVQSLMGATIEVTVMSNGIEFILE